MSGAILQYCMWWNFGTHTHWKSRKREKEILHSIIQIMCIRCKYRKSLKINDEIEKLENDGKGNAICTTKLELPMVERCCYFII